MSMKLIYFCAGGAVKHSFILISMINHGDTQVDNSDIVELLIEVCNMPKKKQINTTG